MNGWKITILGCGGSMGVPHIGCTCPTCSSPHPRNKRLRTAALLEHEDDGYTIAIDCGPDFRQQLLEARCTRLDAILFTHLHSDHILGLNDIRSYLAHNKKTIDLYASKETQAELERIFGWMFSGKDWATSLDGRNLAVHTIAPNSTFSAGPLTVMPLLLEHGKSCEVLGFRFGNCAYLTDTNHIPSETLSQLSGLDLVFLDCLGPADPHFKFKHLTIDESVEYAQKIGAKQTYLVHMAHTVEYERDSALLPPSVAFAYDGLSVELS